MRAGIVLAIVLAAAGSAHAQDAPGVAVTWHSNGILVDGTSIYGGAVGGAALDPEQDLIWFVSGDELEVIDLRGDEAPIVIADHWPELTLFGIAGTSNAEFTDDRDGMRYPILQWGKKPKFKTNKRARFLTRAEDKAWRKEIKKIRIVGKAWLKRERRRKPHHAQRTGAALDHVKLPASLRRCTAKKLCGNAYALFGDYELVVAYDNDGGPVECVLHDRTTGLVAPPTPDGTASWVEPRDADLKIIGACLGYAVEPGGSYVVDAFSCDVNADRVQCSKDAVRHLGWTAPDFD